MEKVLTIAIPAYNMEEYLDKCLTSLIVKGSVAIYLDIIIINDGSKDTTLNIAKKYSNKYPELFRIIDKQNGNWGSCINVAAKEALGKYFLILDADDWLNTRELENFIEILQNGKNVDMFIYNCFLIKGNEKKTMFDTNMEENKIYQISEIKNLWDYSCFIHCIALKTPIMRQIHLTEGIPYCDVEVCAYMFNYIQTVMIYNKCLYNYLIGRLGQTVEMNSYIKNLSAIIKIYKRYNEEHSQDENILYLQQKAIVPLLQKLYQANLLYKTSSKDYEMFKKIDKEIYEDFILRNKIYGHTYMKVKYVKLWSFLRFRYALRLLVWLNKFMKK